MVVILYVNRKVKEMSFSHSRMDLFGGASTTTQCRQKLLIWVRILSKNMLGGYGRYVNMRGEFHANLTCFLYVSGQLMEIQILRLNRLNGVTHFIGRQNAHFRPKSSKTLCQNLNLFIDSLASI